MIPPWVSDYIGLPYLTGGRDRAGLDCWGLFALVWAEQLGRSLPDYHGPNWEKGGDHQTLGAAAVGYARASFREIEMSEAQVGDGILLRVSGAPIHVGMWVAPETMLHIEEGCGAVLERLDSSAWRRRILSVWRRIDQTP